MPSYNPGLHHRQENRWLNSFRDPFSVGFLLKLGLFILILFVFTSLFLFINGGPELELATWSQDGKSSRLKKKIENIDDYDAGCSGFSMGEIIREQKKILESVRRELIESQSKLDEYRKVYDELQRTIPQRQLELSTIEGEIEAAHRTLLEFQAKRNVRVYLPHEPLFPASHSYKTPSKEELTFSLENIFDLSRCSITSFMPIFIQNSGGKEGNWIDSFKSAGYIEAKSPDTACFVLSLINGSLPPDTDPFNKIFLNYGSPITAPHKSILVQSTCAPFRRTIDFALNLDVSEVDENSWESLPQLLPFSRKNYISVIIDRNQEVTKNLDEDLKLLQESSKNVEDSVEILDCRTSTAFCDKISEGRAQSFKSSIFCVIFDSPDYLRYFYEALQNGCVPALLSLDLVLPFDDLIDWRQAAYRMPAARLPELHFILRSFAVEDILEMRRKGRMYYSTYLGDRNAVARTLLAALRTRLQIPPFEAKIASKNKAKAFFNGSFTSPNGYSISAPPAYDDDSIGPLETSFPSPTFLHNFTKLQMYSYDAWNVDMMPWKSGEHLIGALELPAEAEFHEDTKIGFRPIEPGSGVEFSRALGGNRQREQFTIVLLTYERDSVLSDSLKRLYQMPYLNKVIVIWNSINREPPDSWPRLHVPVEFIKVKENSLNNRFVPWDRIETEAVLSLDDDIDLMQQELVFAFRVWRENRDRIVGFPARHHARFGDSMFYNSNHTCQLSMILTGAAFLHKSYLEAYTYVMPIAIRRHVDRVMNCEDLAMNYLVSHLTRKPPIKSTSRWTLKCPTCTESLWKSESHFDERHECMRLFTKIYGYNPLKYSQFRADSILYKTKVPPNHQKCFKIV
ncbi:unnamed protein product [Caenorhabditis auriculariae]|uniref:Uncharacterized protein n=1 Tax=Caenorhabditis auriculariae TaxID=2777116 RepID=A0A8S1GS95_9PELO|nr:unnamed protein product [Caenorhabditis auriculariae]